MFEESLSLKHDALDTTDHRVQITLWDYGGSHTHKSHCHGWLSFGVRDLMNASTPNAGWFKLLSEAEGRTQYEACDPPAAILSVRTVLACTVNGNNFHQHYLCCLSCCSFFHICLPPSRFPLISSSPLSLPVPVDRMRLQEAQRLAVVVVAAE